MYVCMGWNERARAAFALAVAPSGSGLRRGGRSLRVPGSNARRWEQNRILHQKITDHVTDVTLVYVVAKA